MAIIREIHTYGKLADISKRDKNSLPAMHAKASQEGPQHIGLGKNSFLKPSVLLVKNLALRKSPSSPASVSETITENLVID
jgi:hypothetical protein